MGRTYGSYDYLLLKFNGFKSVVKNFVRGYASYY
jgi:hypothetical protein